LFSRIIGKNNFWENTGEKKENKTRKRKEEDQSEETTINSDQERNKNEIRTNS
tara:strand:+ start:596 stop:754 length:159 start_codon:yes stop_codon:yes gene_type:complete